MARLRSKIRVERLPSLTKDAIAGHFTSTSAELGRRVGPFLGGNDLYLFPDGSYFYCEWADIEPVTIRDKGVWVIYRDELKLTSDSDINWNPGVERHYVLARRHSHAQEILAIGIDRDLHYFEQHAKKDPELMLLIVSKVRVNGISQNDSLQLKKELMRKGWRPEYFKSE